MSNRNKDKKQIRLRRLWSLYQTLIDTHVILAQKAAIEPEKDLKAMLVSDPLHASGGNLVRIAGLKIDPNGRLERLRQQTEQSAVYRINRKNRA